jgi:hypothetical protein
VLSQPEGEDSNNDNFDDPSIKTHSTERKKALEEYRIFCNICKKQQNRPQTYVGTTVKLGHLTMSRPIEMGKVATRGEDIRAYPPFVQCTLANFVGDKGRFDLVGFLKLQKNCFPALFKLSVCIASIRTNEVGCKRFFSMAGCVSCPRRTRLNVRNYKYLSKVFIDKRWVVAKYILMERTKAWCDLESEDDLRVSKFERELQAKTLGVNQASMPPILHEDPFTINFNDNSIT